MAWNGSHDYQVEEILTASTMNTYVDDNLLALLNPTNGTGSRTTNTTTTSATFADIASLTTTLTTNGGVVLVLWSLPTLNTSNAGNPVTVDVVYDSSSVSGDVGVAVNTLTSGANGPSGAVLITGLAAGSHTFKLQWKITGGATASTNAGYSYITATEF